MWARVGGGSATVAPLTRWSPVKYPKGSGCVHYNHPHQRSTGSLFRGLVSTPARGGGMSARVNASFSVFRGFVPNTNAATRSAVAPRATVTLRSARTFTTATTPLAVRTITHNKGVNVGRVCAVLCGGTALFGPQLYRLYNGQRLQCETPWDVNKIFDYHAALAEGDILTEALVHHHFVLDDKIYSAASSFATWGRRLFVIGCGLLAGVTGAWASNAVPGWAVAAFGLPVLAIGVACRIVAGFIYFSYFDHGYNLQSVHYEVGMLPEATRELTALLDSNPQFKEFIGDYKNMRNQVRNTYKVMYSTPPLFYGNEKRTVAFMFLATGTKGKALVRVLADQHVKDTTAFENAKFAWVESVEKYINSSLYQLINILAAPPARFPDFPEMPFEAPKLAYVEALCTAGSNQDKTVLMLDNMDTWTVPKLLLPEEGKQ
eukprot:TRINITY_DN538_c0_g3_i1.p1 TRINITY_DN538_c0_g3~~TRINITY_DN538_c0_g3_i1.p1  ORF type:complete len:432 (-),score=51.78 TRINITY_DN538_c0_g3_i1:305-1600(-)